MQKRNRIPTEMEHILPAMNTIIQKIPNPSLRQVHDAMQEHPDVQVRTKWKELVDAAMDANKNRDKLRSFEPSTKKNDTQAILRPGHESAVLYALAFNKEFSFDAKTKKIKQD
ncbi:MAG: hypothetical protein Q8P02_00590 [Candidatus Micrarchaeota archaeon]|nr:hypothetical protein [Candidatus Micrarchaeota archaeon]